MNRTISRGVRNGLAMIGIFACSENGPTGPASFASDDLPADAARVATVSVVLVSPSIQVGDTTRAIATLRDFQNAPVNRPVTWSSSNAAVASVRSDGLVTGTGEGTAVITAARGSALGSATINVGTLVTTASANPGTVTDLAVTGTDSAGVTLSFTQVDDGTGQPAKYDVRYAVPPISWGIAPSVASGSCTTPLAGTGTGSTLTCAVTGLKTSTTYNFQLVAFRGTLNQNAIFGGLSNVAAGTTKASITPTPVASVTVSPATASVQIGATVQLSATLRDSSGNVLTGRSVVWSSSNGGVATVSGSALVTGVAAGTAQINAVSEGKSGAATITVPAAASGNPGSVTDLSITAIDSVGVALSFTQVDDGTGQPARYDVRYAVAPISWGSAAEVTTGTCRTPVVGTAIGSVLTCVVGGLTPATKYNFELVAFRGTMNSNAVYGGLSNIASATTTATPAAPVASVQVSPASTSVQVGSAVQLSATTRDANNNVLTGRTVTWSSSNNGVATVSTSGLVTGVTAGTATITATSETKSGTATVTVTQPSTTGWRGNEPAGMSLISDQPFTSLPSNGWTGFFNYDIASDGTGPRSPPGAFENIYPAGWGGGGNPGLAELDFTTNYRTLYVCMYLKFSSNWQGHDSGVNKVLHLWVGGLNHLMIVGDGVGSGPLTAEIRMQGITAGGNFDGGTAGIYNSSIQFVRGQWHLVELIASGNTGSNRDGSASLYVDGKLASSASGIEFEPGGPLFNLAKLDPTWGGIGGTVTSTMSLRVDHIFMSGK